MRTLTPPSPSSQSPGSLSVSHLPPPANQTWWLLAQNSTSIWCHPTASPFWSQPPSLTFCVTQTRIRQTFALKPPEAPVFYRMNISLSRLASVSLCILSSIGQTQPVLPDFCKSLCPVFYRMNTSMSLLAPVSLSVLSSIG